MHERQPGGPIWSPAQLAQMREGIAAWFAGQRYGDSIAEVDQCVNFGAAECTGRAEENGWCSGCWALIAPPD